jgi:ATP-binding cassette subfamily C protein
MSGAEGTSTGEKMRFLARVAGKRRLIILFGLMIASSLSEGLGLLMLVPIVHLLTAAPSSGQGEFWLGLFDGWSAPQLLASVVALIALRAVIVFMANESRRALGLHVTRHMRMLTHESIMQADWRWLSGQNSSDHAAMIMGEADRVGTMADRALTILTLAITLTILFATALMISPELAGAMTMLGVMLALPFLILRRKKGTSAQRYTLAYLRLQRIVSNGLQRLRAARIANAESELAGDFRDASTDLEQEELGYFRWGHALHLVFQIFAAAMLAAAIYAALFIWQTPLSIFVPVLLIAIRAVPLIGNFQTAWLGWTHAGPALEAITQFNTAAEQHREEDEQSVPSLLFSREIELSHINIGFAGRDNPVLHGFTLKIPKGGVIAIAGPSGSGKSTLADLLCGLVAPDSGFLSVDGQELDGAGRKAWRNKVAYLEQVPFFIDATIAQNLTWGLDNIGEVQMLTALETASAQFVLRLPQGVETPMGEGGRQFSGGEKQRIALARALMRDPLLLILDEVTAALDAENAEAIRQSITRLRGSYTIVLLSHDRLLLDMADEVVELGSD